MKKCRVYTVLKLGRGPLWFGVQIWPCNWWPIIEYTRFSPLWWHAALRIGPLRFYLTYDAE